LVYGVAVVEFRAIEGEFEGSACFQYCAYGRKELKHLLQSLSEEIRVYRFWVQQLYQREDRGEEYGSF
jgi:hypothetical protein